MAQFVTHIQPTLVESAHHYIPGHHGHGHTHHKECHTKDCHQKECLILKDQFHKDGHHKDHDKSKDRGHHKDCQKKDCNSKDCHHKDKEKKDKSDHHHEKGHARDSPPKVSKESLKEQESHFYKDSHGHRHEYDIHFVDSQGIYRDSEVRSHGAEPKRKEANGRSLHSKSEHEIGTKPIPPHYIDIPPLHVENKTSDGNTSFLRAARAGHLDKVLEHLQSNIDINTSNANGLNALHLASKDGHVEVVTELLKRGAVVDSATKKGNTALHIASLAGQEEVVKLLVQHGASVNVQSQNGFTPLYMAAQENHDSVVKYLLANGANQSLATEDGFTPLAVAMQQGHDKVVAVLLENDTRGKVRLPALHIAAKKDDVKAAKLLLENEHNPDVTSKSGFTPLHIASHYGNEGIANLLIQKGADVNYAAKHNITPLHVAAKWGKTNMVALLLEKGANIESKTRDGLTPLHCAARSGHEQVVDMLLERGAPISSKTKNGLAPLHMAAQGDHVDAARILLYHRAPVDEVTVDYLTALHVAAHCGHARVAKLLLDRQADANARALNGFTPLHIACKKNRIKVVELLLKHGASIGATTESGLTPLHVASFMGCMNIVIYLLQHEANPDVPTVRGETPLHLAARANQTDIIRILLRNGAQVDARAREQQTPLHIASRLGNVDIVMLLLQHGAQVDTTTKDMYTALHIAAKEGQDEVAAVLLDHGASLTATTKKGFTPLHLAAKYGNMKVAKLLLQKEAPVDAQGKNGVTPLHVASHYDHQNVALLLLDKGASPHATAKNGHTPLHIAAKKNQMDIATTLLEYGAQANAESKAGFTPLHLSAQEGHTDMSSLLIEHHADTNHHAKNGLAPLHLCAQEDRVDVAQILVKESADKEAITKAGYTPLHVASHFGQINMVRFLLQSGADVKATTGIGYTPLHQASQQGHANVVSMLLEHSAQPNATTTNGQTPLQIAQKLGYISVIETLKVVTKPSTSPIISEEKYRVVAPEAMHETFMSDSEEEGGEDTMLADQPYRYLTVDEMKSLGDDSLPIDVTRDERVDSNRMINSVEGTVPPQAIEDSISPQHMGQNYSEFHSNKYTPDNVDIAKHPITFGFLVSFLVDARGGAMRGCRHSGVRVIVPSRCAASPTRITCRYVKPQRTPHPPPLMEGEALASRVLELGPVGAKFLGPVILEVPHFAALRGKEREIVILRSDNGETWREHTVEASEEIVNDVLNDSFEAEDLSQLEDISSGRITRILTHEFPQYFAVVSRIRQEVHAIGPEGGMVSSTVVPQVQAVFPQGALTKKIKVGLQAQPIDPELAAKLLGHGVAVSPVVTVEPRRRKFHKAITLSMPAPRAHSQGMINQYSGSAPTLRLLCSITGGTTRAQWEDVTGSTPLTFVNDCVSFTTTVSARFWLMDCRNIGDATKMATELYREAIHVPFMAKFVVFAKRVDPLEARLRVFCMTDDKEDKTLEHQEHFTEVAKSRDVEVLEGKPQYIEFAGNLVPITKSGEQLQFAFRAFRENRLPFSVRVKDQHADTVGRCLFMREPKVAKGEPPQQPICILNIVLPDDIVTEIITLTDTETLKRSFFKDDFYQRTRLSDMSNLLGDDWVPLAAELGLSTSEINVIKSEYPDSVAKQAQSMLRMWRAESGNKAQKETLEEALRRIGREDIIPQCLNVDALDHAVSKVTRDQGGFDSLKEELGPSRDASLRRELSLDAAVYERDLMKESESVESLVQAEKKDPLEINKIQNIHEHDESKYSAEEKEVTEQEENEAFKKSVQERKQEIEKRLSEDHHVPASSQRVEIVQEISSIKRQSLVEDKIIKVTDIDEPIEAPEATTTTTVKTVTTTTKPEPKPIIEKTTKPIEKSTTVETVTKTTTTTTTSGTELTELQKKLAAQKEKIETSERTDEPTSPLKVETKITTTIVETRTIDSTHNEPTAQDKRRDSELFEGVTQELERLDTTKRAVPKPKATEDLKSPKQSRTPPPSPADFILRDQAATIQEWGSEKPSIAEKLAEKPVPDAAHQDSTNIVSTEDSVVLTKEQVGTKETSTFIQKETQNENACLPQKLSSPELSDKANKELDNKKEKSKSKGGFFSSLKSFVGRSFDSSDSESKEEKTPKKKKKDKAPKKGKKKEESPKQSPKFKLKITSPQPDKKVITTALHIDNIPPIDEIESNEVQVTDIDAEPIHQDVKTQATNIVNNVINDGQDMASKLMEDKIHEFNFEGTITPEEVRKSAEPIIINEDEFLVVIEPSRVQVENEIESTYEDIEKPDDKKDKFSDKEDEPKTDTMKSRRSVGFLKMFSKKDSKDSDEEPHDEQPTGKRHEEHRKSSSFFGIFSKKSKDDPEEKIEKERPLTEEEIKQQEESRQVQQHMMDSSRFLMREVEYFEDVRPKQITFITEPQQQVEATQQESLKKIAAEKAEQALTTQQHMVDAASFLMREVELFEDVRPTIKAAQAKEVNKLVEMPLPTITKLISEEIQQHMVDTSHFILKEVELFEDVRPIVLVPAGVLIEQKSPEKQMVVENKKLKQETETPKQEPSDSEKDTRSDSETLECKPGFFSKFQFGGKSLDKDDSKEKEKQKKQKKKDRKSGGFFSRIGEKFSGGSQEIVDDLDQTVTVVKKDVKEKLEQTKGDVQSKIIETKDITLSAKDVSAVKYKDTIPAVKDSAKDKTENTNAFFETKLQHEKHSTVTAADSTTEKLKDTSVDVRDISEKTGGFFSNLSKKLKDTTIETTDTVILAKDAAINKSKEKSSEIKEAVKDDTYKAEKAISDFGLKIDDTTLNDKDKFASGAVEIKDSVKYQTDKACEALGDFTKKLYDTAQDIKASAIAASDSTVEELKDASVEVKDKVKETSENTGGFFSSLGRKIKDTSTEPKDFVKETTIDKTEQVEEALTDLGQKISGTASDSTDSFTEAKDIAAEKDSVVASDIEHTFKDKSEKVGTILIDMSSNIQETFHEGKETSISAKDSAVQKVKDDSAEVKEKVKDSAEKTGGFFSGLGKKIKGGASKTNVLSAKDSTTEKLKEAKTDIKNTAANVVDAVKDKTNKTGETLSDFSDHIKSKAVETIKSTVATEDTTIQVVKDTSVDIKNKVKDSAEKTSGFFRGLGKKVEGTTIETSDSVASAVDLAIEKVNETKIDVIDSLKDKTEHAGEAISDLDKQIGKMADETKNSVTSATDSAVHMVKDTVSDTKDKTFKTGVSLKDLGKETQESTHDKFVSAKCLSIDNTKGVISEIIDTAEKSGGFFSSLGRKLKGTATETKDTVVSAKVSAAATVNEKAANVRESAKQTSERASEALTEFEKKIDSSAYEGEESIVVAADLTVQQAKATTSDFKEKVKDSAEKAGGFFSHLGQAFKENVIEATDSTIGKTKDCKERFTDKSEKTSVGKKIEEDAYNKEDKIDSAKDFVVSATDSTFDTLNDNAQPIKEQANDKTEKADKDGGFFSGINKNIKGTTAETKDTIKSMKDSDTHESKISAVTTMDAKIEKIKDTKSAVNEKVKESAEKTDDEALTDFCKKIDEKAQATKETIASTKDSGIEKIKQVKFDLEEFTQSKSDKTSVALDDLGKKVSEKTHDTKTAASDSANETLSESKTKVKETAEKASGFFSNFGKKIKDTTTETKDSVAVAKVSATETIKDKVLEVKDAAKEKTEHVSEALSCFGSKIDDAAHDGTEKIVAVKDTSVQAVKVKSSDVKDKIKESSEKAGGFFSGLGRKIKGTATDIKVKTNETATGVKEIISDQTENAGTAISDSGELMKHSAHEHKQKLVSTSDACTEKLHDSASAVKDEVKTSAEQSEFFLSCLGHKTAETTVKSKDIIQSKASDLKNAVRDQSEKNSNVGSETGKNIGLFVHGTKENLVEAKDSILGRGNILASEINSDVHDSAVTTTGFFSDLEQNLSDNTTQESEKAKESTSDAAEAITVETLSDLSQKIHQITVNGKDAVVSAKIATAEQIKKTSSSIESSVKDVPTECFSGLEAKVRDTSTQLEKRIVKTTETTKDYILEVRDSSADNLKHITSEVADSLTSTKDSAVEKLENAAIEIKKSATPHITKAEDTLAFSQDKRSEVEDTSRDITEKSEGFLKGLGKMFTGTATEVKDSVLRAKDSGAETVKEKASEVKEAANKKAEKAHDIVTNFGQKFGETAQDSKDSIVTAKDSTAPKFENTSSNVKDKVQETTEKAAEATNKVITAKDSTLDKIDETSSVAKKTVEDKTEELNGIGKMIKATAQSGKEKNVSAKDVAAVQSNENALDMKDKIKDNSEKAESFFSSLGLKLKSSADETKHNIVAAKDVTAVKLQETAIIVQETIKDTEKTTGLLGDLGPNLIDATHYAKNSVSEKAELTKAAISEKAEQVNDSTIEKVKDSSSEKFVKTSADITKIVAESTGKLSGVVSDLRQKVSDTAHDTKESIVSPKDPLSIKTETKILTNSIIEKADILVSDTKQSFVNTSDKIDAFDAKLGNVTNEAAEQIKQTTAQVHSSVKLPEKGKRKNKGKRSTENFGLPEKVLSPDAQIPGQASFTTKMSDYVCYVTTPTMQRRGIGGSQRLTKDERPAPLDVSNMPIDISSDEEEYIVTEPGDLQNNLNLDGELLSSSPLLIESLQGEITPERQISKDNEQSQELLDVKRRPLFHIGSKDEESGDWGDKSEKSEGMQSPVDLDMPELISTVKPEIKADIDLIENKLQELDRALGDLEKANIDLDANESASGLASDVALEATESEDKINRKLRRVERRFERMASETMEKDIKDAKEQQITSPEVEAKREEEFRTMVSQLSQDEVSECQRLYSTLWDEATFTPSEEWDSKTPDSQPDDIQDLPQESSGTTASGPAPSTLRDESTAEPGPETTESAEAQLRNVSDQHQLSSEMMQLLAEMEKHSKQ